MTARWSRVSGSDSTEGRSPVKTFVAALISASGEAAMSGPPCGQPVRSMDNCDDALWFAAQVETSGEPITAAAVVKALGRSERRAELDAEMAEANTAREAEIASAIPGALETLVDAGMLGDRRRPGASRP